MAVDMGVKSESWLNLAIDRAQICRQRRSESIQDSNKTSIDINKNKLKLQKRHSIGGSENYYSPVELRYEFNNNNSNNNNHQHELHSSNCSIANITGQRHLLIRLRQQSYQLNRSSTATLSSNLSNSVELNSTLLVGSSDLQAHAKSKLFNVDTDTNSAQSNQIKLKNEPRRLQIIKDKLKRGGRLLANGRTKSGSSSSSSLSSPKRSFARSWSSFSECINGKLVNIRHSWKHFLYHYNHNEQINIDDDDDDELNASKAKSPLLGCINKSQLTNDWIARHHCYIDKERPKSLQITSSPHLKHLNANTNNSNSNSNTNTNTNSNGNNFSNKSNFKFYSSQLTPPTNQQVAREPAQFQQTAHADSASSTTLVSQQQVSPCSPQQRPNPKQRDQISDNQEEEEHSLESLSSGSSKRILDLPDPNRKAPIPTISVFAERDEAAIQKEEQFQQPTKNLKQASTSDYWSTVTTSSGDYYFQAANMAPPPPPLQQQQKRHQVAAYLAPANQPANVSQPILVADQDYYLEVAKASQQQHQLNAINRLSKQPTGGQPPLHSRLALDETQMSLAANQIVNANLLSDMAFHGFQRQAQQQQVLREDDYDEDYAVPADESCRLDRGQVELVQMIGEGQKGFVFLGKLQSKDGSHISDVAIKTLKYETNQLIDKLMREAAMMRQLEHPHIIKFIGVCPETPALIAMELAQFGEVKQYLKVHKQLIYTSQLVLFTFQISTALSYLESKHYVHRDVAARNVLVCSHNCVKLADFGLSRNLQTVQQQQPSWLLINQASNPNQCQLINDFGESDKSHYVAATKGKLPVRWLAPESLAFRRFTSASDVWMFAVCSWELFQYGQVRPWSHIRNNQVLLAIEAGQRLPQPDSCPMRLYQLMLQCWSYAPVQRPKFRDLKQNLWSIYLNERGREQLEIDQQQEQQRAILEATNWKNQERIIQVVNNNRVQQQKRLLEQQAVQNLHRINRANIENRLTNNHDNLDLQAQNHQQHSPVLATGVIVSNTITSNFSGYSSTTATGEHSNNSSRSSSMGSLVRNQSLRAKQQQQKQLQYQLNQMQPAMLHNNHQSQLLLNKTVVGRQPEDFSENILSNERATSELVQQEKIDANMRRFQRPTGRVLQKQRSQSSIVKDLPKYGDQDQSRSGRKTKYGYDDHALLANSIHNKNTLLQINVMEDDDDDDGDRDEDEDSSGPETNEMSRSKHLRAKTQHQVPNEHHMRLLTGLVQHVRIEPAYEGIQNGQVAMINNERCSPSDRCLQNNGNILLSKPDEWQTRATQKPIVSDDEIIKREQKLSDTIQALKITPLKAKLNHVRQTSLEPSGKQIISSKQIDKYPQNHSNAPSPSSSACLKEDSQQSPNQKTREEVEQLQEDDRQRLALHQRLLGRIRPISGNKNLQRRSINFDQREGGLADCKKVDQSLEILESLMAEKNFSSNKITPNDRKAQYQNKLLNDMNNNLQVELRHRLLSRRSRPKGFSFPNYEL